MSFLINKIFNKILSEFDSGALLDKNGQILALKYENLVDIGTLGATAQTVLKYFPLKMGDAVVLNDPYSGGSVLSTLSLMTPLNENIFILTRTGYRPHLTLANKVDEEGLRIPPTPIATKREINLPILQAMAEHPLAPENLQSKMIASMQSLFQQVDQFAILCKNSPGLFREANLQKYLDNCQQKIQKLLSEEAFGETTFETKLHSGENIKLSLAHSSLGLKLNFSGTSSSKRLCLTDSGTFGACAGALIAFLQKDIPLNAGFLSLIHVESPLGSLLNAKYPSPTFLGMTEGATLVAKTVLSALNKLSHNKDSADSASLPVMVHLKFKNGKSFFENIPGGTGAGSQQDGADALHFWIRNTLETSVEEIERRFPIRILQFGLRQGSGGKGQFRGGHGMTREYELLQPAELCWLKESAKLAQQGRSGGLDGTASDIFIMRNGEKINITESHGSNQLLPGDKLFVSSAGGGGYGKVKNS